MEETEFNKKYSKLETKHRESVFKLVYVLLSNNESISDAKPIVENELKDIHEADKIVFETIFDLAKTEKSITSLKVKKAVKEKWQLNYNDYFKHISEIIKDKSVDFENTVKEINDNYKKIKLIEGLYKLSNQVEKENYDSLVNTFNMNVERISTGKQISSKSEQLKTFKDRVLKAKENYGKGELLGFTTYVSDLDQLCLGVDEESFNIVAARPAMGKSAFILSIIANHIRMKTLETLVMFSLEMPADQLMSRVAAILSGVHLSQIRSGDLSEEEIDRIFDAATEIEESNLIIEDTASVTIYDIADKLKEIKKKTKIGAIFIDYLQLINGHSGVTDRRLVVDEISRKSKLLAKELKAPIFALSQLNRKLEERADKRPMLSDLRESGGLEQDADRIMFIYRDSVYKDEEKNKPKPKPGVMEEDITEIILAKNRNGAIGTVYVKYLKQITYFQNVDESKVTQEILKNIKLEMAQESSCLDIDITTDNLLEIELNNDVPEVKELKETKDS